MTVDRAVFLRERFGVEARSLVPIEGGWDSDVLELDGKWIFRFPRRPEVEEWIRKEVALLPELAAALSVPVPRFEFVSYDPVCVGYEKLEGQPLRGTEVTAARDLGRFLTELHGFPASRARELGVPAPDWGAAVERRAAEFARRVLPMLERAERQRAQGMFDRMLELASAGVDTALVHHDLGPEHLLQQGGRLTGVIDWSDAEIADPALDLAWPLYGTSDAFSDAAWAAYGREGDGTLRERALLYHRRAPWYEVTYGLDIGDERYVESGLAGLRARLP